MSSYQKVRYISVEFFIFNIIITLLNKLVIIILIFFRNYCVYIK